MADGQELSVRVLGSCRITSPLAPLIGDKRTTQHYVDEDDRVLLDDTLSLVTQRDMPIDALPGI